MTSFSQTTTKILKQVGWFSERQIEIDPLVQELEKNGFEVYLTVKEFLQEFAGIQIPLPSTKRDYHLNVDPQTAMEYFDGTPIHPLRIKFETENNATSCIIGYSNCDMMETLSMDASGRVFGTHIYGDFTLYGNSGSHFIENYLMRGDKDIFRRKISPFNEFRLFEIFSHEPTIASVVSTKQTLFGPSAKDRSNSQYEIDQQMREKGYKVYSVNLDADKLLSRFDFPVYSNLDDIPYPIDIITYNTPLVMSEIIAAALRSKVKTIIPTFWGADPIGQSQSELLGLEYIECPIDYAIKRVSEIE